jgi:hypothetical protein
MPAPFSDEAVDKIKAMLTLKRAMPVTELESVLRAVIYERAVYAAALDETIRQFDYQGDESWRQVFRDNMIAHAKERLKNDLSKSAH